MKKILLISLVLILAVFTARSQQLPLYSQYTMNGFLLNPAMAGSVDYTPVRLTARQQWVGIEGAPSTQAISVHTLLQNQKMGLGGYLFNDMFGPMRRSGVQASYAYHLTLNRWDSKLAFGLSITAFQFVMDESKFTLYDPDDNAVSYLSETNFVPDASFGMYLYGGRYYAGFSVAQLFEWQVDMGDYEQDINKMVRHYFVSAGYTFDIDEKFELQPSFLVKTTGQSPVQLDFNVKGLYNRTFWMGCTYRHDAAVIGLIGFKVDKFFMGYAFDYSLSNISNYTTGSHEIMIGYNFGEGMGRGASLL